MSITNLLYMSYWFQQPFTVRGWTLWIWVGGFLVMVLAGLILRIVMSLTADKPIKEVFRRFGNLALVMGFAGLFWMFLRQERVYILAFRFWLLVWLGISGYWLYRITWYLIKRVPAIREENLQRETLEKYLPKRNK